MRSCSETDSVVVARRQGGWNRPAVGEAMAHRTGRTRQIPGYGPRSMNIKSASEGVSPAPVMAKYEQAHRRGCRQTHMTRPHLSEGMAERSYGDRVACLIRFNLTVGDLLNLAVVAVEPDQGEVAQVIEYAAVRFLL